MSYSEFTTFHKVQTAFNLVIEVEGQVISDYLQQTLEE